MTNEERKEMGRLHWMPAVRMWNMGFSAKLIAEVMGYSSTKSFLTRKNQLRSKYPNWFTPREPNFVPISV